MPRPHFFDENLDIAKATKATLDCYKRGVYLEKLTGKSIDDLKTSACKARFVLASRFLRCARQQAKRHPRESRMVIGRSYYAMYHAARAVVYWQTGGDDHEDHSKLPQQLPGDLPDRDNWQNKLRNARLERNRADYDPFPRSDASFATSAKERIKECKDFLVAIRKYLISKGVAL